MRVWLVGIICCFPLIANSFTSSWPGVGWPDVGGGGGGTTIDNYTIGTWYVNDGGLWVLTVFGDLCIKSRGASVLAVCATADEVGIPFSSPNGINIVDLTCTLEPSKWDNTGEWVELEVAIHVDTDTDRFGTPTGIITRLLSDGDAPKVFSSGDTTYTSSVTEGYLTLQTRPDENTWTADDPEDFVQAICSIEVN